MRHLDAMPVTLALLALTACSVAPTRPDAPPAEAAPAGQAATDPVAAEATACETTTTLLAYDMEGGVDLGPFLPAMRAAFGEDMLVCASPAGQPDDACDPLIEGVFGDATVPDGFFLFDAKDFTLDVSVMVAASAAKSTPRTACDPPVEELTSEAQCEDLIHAFADRVSGTTAPMMRVHDELDRRIIHSAAPPVPVCQGLLLARMIPRTGVYADKIIFQHALFSLHQGDARADMFALTALMVDVEGRSEVDDILVYTANTMRAAIDTIDPATRASSTSTTPAPTGELSSP